MLCFFYITLRLYFQASPPSSIAKGENVKLLITLDNFNSRQLGQNLELLYIYRIPLDWLPKRVDHLGIGANNFQSTDDPLM